MGIMYKRMSVEELLQIQTGFFERVRVIQSREGHNSFLGFLNYRFADAQRVYLFEKNKPYMRFYSLNDNTVRIVDETEKIDLMLDKVGLDRIHNVLKDKGVMRGVEKNESILDQLLAEFKQGNFTTIAGKPFLVYDIETTLQKENPTHFEMSYDIISDHDHQEELAYSYIDRQSMRNLADRLLSYDGWIIGYNNIGFDNPVLLKNCGYSQEQIECLHKKSLDPFLLFQKLTGRRMSLANVAGALIGVGKTLGSGMEGAELLLEYKKSGDLKTLEKVKLYCKNDVEITLGVVLYLLAYKNVHFDGSLYTVDEETLISLGTWDGGSIFDDEKETNERWFS